MVLSHHFVEQSDKLRQRAMLESALDVFPSPQAPSRFDEALAEMISFLKKSPDESIVSAMVNSNEEFTFDEIRSNVLVTIGGGLNEPRDAIGTAVYGLLTHRSNLPFPKAKVTCGPRCLKRRCAGSPRSACILGRSHSA